MRGVGNEVTTHLLLALEAPGHLVERVGQGRDLGGSVTGHACGVIPFGDPARRQADLFQRPGQHPGHHDRQDDARQCGHQHGGRDDPGDRLVVHLPGVVRGVASLDHQGREHVGADHGDADGEDDQADGRGRQGRGRDPGGDPASDHVESALVAGSASVVAGGAAR